MRTIQEYHELVDSICKRRFMYVSGGSFCEVCAFLEGYAGAMDPNPLRCDEQMHFNGFVAARLGYPPKLYWPYILQTASAADEHAINRLRDLLTEYLGAVRDGRIHELVAEAHASLQRLERNPPEQVRCWRKFSRALHRGDKDVLQELTLEHDNASVLWESAYPDDVIPLMDQIAESYAIPIVSQSEDGSEAQIMTPDFGLLRLKRVDGQWRIDAEPIIQIRLGEFTKNSARRTP